MSQLTSAERVFAALERREPDRVPHFESNIDMRVIEAMVGKHCSLADFVDLMDIDAIQVSPTYKREWLNEVTFRDEWGITRRFGKEAYPMPADEFAPIKTWDDLRRYQFPSPDAEHRWALLREVVERFKGKRAIVAYVHDTFSDPRDLRGYMQILIDCAKDPRIVSELVWRSVEYNIELARAARKLGADIVLTGDDIAMKSGPLFSPRHYRKLFWPGHCTEVKAWHDMGMYVIKHTDGNIMPIIDLLIDTGIDCIDPIDPLAGMDLAEIKTRYGPRVAIKGNVNCVTTLVSGTPEDVINEVKQCIAVAGKGGGYIISSSNSIHQGVKPENYKAMLDAIKKYGVYAKADE